MERKSSWHIIGVGAYRALVAIVLLAGVIAGDLSIGRAVECLAVAPALAGSSYRLSVLPEQGCLFQR